jgi:hypothetical protein
MCILTQAANNGDTNPADPSGSAKLLHPQQRQALALQALAGTRPVTQLAEDYQVSRQFVYHQADKAEQALAEAFTPDPPADRAVLFHLPVTELWLKRLILALLLIGHCSYRGVYEILRDLFHCVRSLGHIHNVAQAAMDRARALNQHQDLARVDIGAHDEIFQTQQPVLVGVEVDSTYCYLLSQEEHRDGDTWGLRLLELQARGFAPRAIISDSGSGMQAGHALALPNVSHRGDVFHVLKEVTPLLTFLDNRAYQALHTCLKLEQQQAKSERTQGRPDSSVSQKLRHARPTAEAAVALADDVATLVGWLRQDILTLAGPCHAERVALYDFVVAELQARRSQCPHRLNPICTYLVNQRDAVLAFAQQLDADLEAVAAAFEVSPAVVRAVLQVHVLDEREARRWPAEAALRRQLGRWYYPLQKAVAWVARRTVRASSVVENLNSRLRNYFFLRRHLGPAYLQLLQFFLNHHRYLRSEHPERVEQSPAELLTGRAHAHWLELLGLADPLVN